MVSTRGGARTGADDIVELPLRKKPVRKAPVKATQPTTTATKAKATRSKKTTEPEPTQDDLEDEEVDVPAKPVAKAKPGRKPKSAEEPPKPTRKATGRAEKEKEPQKPTVAKTTTARTQKAKSAEEEKPTLPPPAQSRATRGTRATVAKEKALPPLSPKKITQVTKARGKAASATTAKTTNSKSAAAKTNPRGRPPLKRRNESDENAQIPATKAEQETLSEIVVKPKAKVTKKPEPVPTEAEDEVAESTRPRAPIEEADESDDELQQDEIREMQVDASDSEDELASEQFSTDELAGPETPMKRSSPTEYVRYSTARKLGPLMQGPMKTPTRRFAVLGTQQGTPQTEKPYCKPSVPMSAMRPMTAARSRNQAMVFPKLQPLPSLKIPETTMDESDRMTSPVAEGTLVTVSEDVMVDDAPDASDRDSEEPISGEYEAGSTEVQDCTMSDIDSGEHMQINLDMKSKGTRSTPDAEFDSMEDSETTILVAQDDIKDGPVFSLMESTSFEATEDREANVLATDFPQQFSRSEDSLMFTPIESNLDSALNADAMMEAAETIAKTPKPETLVWENIQQEVTIPFNFDGDLTAPRSLSPSKLGNNEEQSHLPDAEAGKETAEAPRQNLGSTRPSLDATVNLSDFIDMKSLSESPRTAPNEQEALVEMIDSESVPSDAHMDDLAISSHETSDKEPETDTTGPSTEVDDRMPDSSQTSGPSSQADGDTPMTPAREVTELDIALEDLQRGRSEHRLPHYATPTIASRRRSVPAIYAPRLVFDNTRPKTSDGATTPLNSGPIDGSRIFTPAKATPRTTRPSTAHGTRSAMKAATKTPVAKTPVAKTPGTSVPLSARNTSFTRTPIARTLFARTPGTSVPDSVKAASPRERFPGLPSSETYEDLVTPAKAHSRTGTPRTAKSTSKQSTPKVTTEVSETPIPERFPGLPSRQTYALETEDKAEETNDEAMEMPRQGAEERFPGLPCRRTYEEHARTAMPATRFRTPTKSSPAKRPATTQKPTSLRRIALTGSRTPMKTPLKLGGATPGQELMTPHPAAPLRGVVALVEVYTSDGGCATPSFASVLQRLGAKTTKTFSERITHLVFKEGPPNTLQRLRVHNKQVSETGIGNEIYCVNSRWVTDCNAEGRRIDETDEAYAVDVEEVPRSAKRRRKSMEPTSLINLGGNVVRDRKSSLGRPSLGRSPLKFDSTPEPDKSMLQVDGENKENCDDEGSPATPAYLAAPSSLVQQTAPVNRVRKLDLKTTGRANRRLTSWNDVNDDVEF